MSEEKTLIHLFRFKCPPPLLLIHYYWLLLYVSIVKSLASFLLSSLDNQSEPSSFNCLFTAPSLSPHTYHHLLAIVTIFTTSFSLIEPKCEHLSFSFPHLINSAVFWSKQNRHKLWDLKQLFHHSAKRKKGLAVELTTTTTKSTETDWLKKRKS